VEKEARGKKKKGDKRSFCSLGGEEDPHVLGKSARKRRVIFLITRKGSARGPRLPAGQDEMEKKGTQKFLPPRKRGCMGIVHFESTKGKKGKSTGGRGWGREHGGDRNVRLEVRK